jgi:Nif-specific regulatory protein
VRAHRGKGTDPVTAPWFEKLLSRVEGRVVDLDALFLELIDGITSMLGADRGTLYLIDGCNHALVSRVAHLPEISEIRLRVGEGVAGKVAQTGRILHTRRGTRNLPVARRIDGLTGYQTQNMLTAPVFSDSGQVVAVLQVLNKKSGEFTAGDLKTVEVLAGQVSRLIAVSVLRTQLSEGQRQPLAYRYNEVIGDSKVMHVVYERAGRAAQTDATVLIRGESGCGKELIARAIHDNSGRCDQPFVKVDCAALPEQLIENELFGHEKGAYTSADQPAEGKVDAAEGGTLVLDEIGELSLSVQSKLLRLLQDRQFFRIGGNRARTCEVRFVCLTHRDLERAVAEGLFRKDLYYRLRVVEIEVAPLRRRGLSDLDRLIDHFLEEYRRRHHRPATTLSNEARGLLYSHRWPGNVRELEHCIESAVVLTDGDVITPDALSLVSPWSATETDLPTSGPAEEIFVTGLHKLREVELAYIRHVLVLCDGNRSQAARTLGIGRSTLLRKLRSG